MTGDGGDGDGDYGDDEHGEHDNDDDLAFSIPKVSWCSSSCSGTSLRTNSTQVRVIGTVGVI